MQFDLIMSSWDPLWESIHSIISWTFNLAQDSWCKLKEIDLDTNEILELGSVEPRIDVESINWFQQNPTEPQLTHRFVTLLQARIKKKL